MSRAIPLLPLWAFVACSMVNITFTFTLNVFIRATNTSLWQVQDCRSVECTEFGTGGLTHTPLSLTTLISNADTIFNGPCCRFSHAVTPLPEALRSCSLQSKLSGESAKLRRVTIGFVMSVCPSARKE